MEGGTPLDGLIILSILAKAAGYAAALLAMGGPLFVMAFRAGPDDVLSFARRLTVAAAVIGLTVLAARFGIRAARISGMGMAGAIDGTMLGFVWDSPLGAAALWRVAGDLLVLTIMLRGALGRWLAIVGAVMIAVSYTRVGHALSDPRLLLAACLIAHLLFVAFWIAALAPLRKAAARQDGAALLHHFGVIASFTVPLLIIVGLVFAWVMTGSFSELTSSAYGAALMVKIGLVSFLLSLAALNKWRLVPALAAGSAGAGPAIRRAITVEMAIVALILLATATLTSVTTPPIHL